MDECLLRDYPELEESHFWWVSRRTLIRRLLRARRDGWNSRRILDVGCGSGVLAGELAAAGYEVSAVDVAAYPQWAQRGAVEFRVGDYLDLASSLGSSDVVLALDVMEHVEDERTFVWCIKENLRPGGHAVITVPAYEWLWSTHDDINHHFRRYTKNGLRKTLAAGGLHVDRCGYVFLGLIGPKTVALAADRMTDWAGATVPRSILNKVAKSYFAFEHDIALRRTDFLPAGTSVIAVCTRND